MNKKKILALVLCMVLLVASSVFGSYAYLTDSEVVENTFTVGKVAITLDELDVDNDENTADNVTYGEEDDVQVRDRANEYHLIPGRTYTKDPIIHVAADSEDCWLFVAIKNEIETIEGDTTIADQMENNGWTAVAGENGVYAYNEIVSAGADVVVFESFTIDGNGVDNDMIAEYEGKSIKVAACAVQAAGFGTAEEAWDAVKPADIKPII